MASATVKIKTVYDSGPYSYSYEVPDDCPEGREINSDLWNEYTAAAEKYEQLLAKIEGRDA